MNKDLRKNFIYSLVVHTTLLVLLAFGYLHGGGSGMSGVLDSNAANKEQLSMNDQPTEVDIIPPPKDKDTLVVKAEKDGMLAKAPHSGDDCTESFGGVGLEMGATRDLQTNEIYYFVKETYPGYPAFKVGVEVGDILLNHQELRGEVGTPITVKISRDGMHMEFMTYRDKICTKKKGIELKGGP